MDRNTYEILLRFRDNPVVRDNPLDDGLTPDEESLVKVGAFVGAFANAFATALVEFIRRHLLE